jgi:hypothetical protein
LLVLANRFQKQRFFISARALAVVRRLPIRRQVSFFRLFAISSGDFGLRVSEKVAKNL